MNSCFRLMSCLYIINNIITRKLVKHHFEKSAALVNIYDKPVPTIEQSTVFKIIMILLR